MPAHVIILGCARSGTSIFGELFEALGCYRYLFEPGLDTVATLDYGSGPVAMKVPKAPPGSAVTPGLPFLLEQLLAIVPEPRVCFWQVRHPLDAVCSLRPGIEADWSHNPRPPDWQAWRQRPLVERCAHHWRYINTCGWRAVAGLARISRYEELVQDPGGYARLARESVGIDPAQAASEIRTWARSVGNRKSASCYEARHQVRWSRLDHTVRVGRWRENLSPEELRLVLPLVSEPARAFGYSLPARPE